MDTNYYLYDRVIEHLHTIYGDQLTSGIDALASDVIGLMGLDPKQDVVNQARNLWDQKEFNWLYSKYTKYNLSSGLNLKSSIFLKKVRSIQYGI